MMPTITIVIDPLKGPQISTNVPGESTYLILMGAANNILMQLLATKQANLIQTITPNGKPALVS